MAKWMVQQFLQWSHFYVLSKTTTTEGKTNYSVSLFGQNKEIMNQISHVINLILK